MDFERYTNSIIGEDSVNSKGEEVLKEYHSALDKFRDDIGRLFVPFVTDVDELKNRMVVHLISTITSNDLGTDKFDLAYRLDNTLDKSGNIVDNAYNISKKDVLDNYIERE